MTDGRGPEAGPAAEPAASRARRDAAFRAAEIATRDALLALTPVQRLEWLAEALDFAWAAGALGAAEAPPRPGGTR